MGAPMIPMIISGVIGAVGSIYQGQAQARAHEAQAAAADSNMRTSQRMASESLKEGAREEEQFRRRAKQFAASQETQLAASGTQMSGSALNVLADTAGDIEQDATMIRYNTLKNRWGYEVQAVNFLNEANAAKQSAKNARTAGYIGAASSILGAASNVWAATPANAKAKGGIINIDKPANAVIGVNPSKSFFGKAADWWKSSSKTKVSGRVA